jgi:DNA-binding LytR/AlgR family response regulator
MINCIIIDDQEEAIEIMCDHVKNKQGLNLVKTFTNPLEAMPFVENNKIDLVFIDVQMPHLNGVDFIESLRAKKGTNIPKFIFTTGFSKYALSGFEQGVSDYLLKPIGFKRFNIAIDRLLNNWTKPGTPLNTINEFFFADVDGKKIKINFKDIACIESSGNYITVFGIKLKVLLYKSLTSIQEILPPEDFVRVHKSYIVSIHYIESIKGNELILNIAEKTKNIPIGATFKDVISAKLRI